MLTVYRILSYLLILVASFIGLGMLMLLTGAFTNPALLLSVFVAAGVVLYSFSSFHFLNKGVLKNQKIKTGRKDFIKVNAYVALFFGVINLFQSVTLIAEPKVIEQLLDQLTNTMRQPMPVKKEELYGLIKGILYFLFIYALILIVHIQITFRLLKQYAIVFEEESADR